MLWVDETAYIDQIPHPKILRLNQNSKCKILDVIWAGQNFWVHNA